MWSFIWNNSYYYTLLYYLLLFILCRVTASPISKKIHGLPSHQKKTTNSNNKQTMKHSHDSSQQKTVDCTCTIMSISDISRFACTDVWSVCVITRSVYVTFVRSCFAFISICHTITKERREKVKNISAKHIIILASITAQYELWNLQKHLNLFVASWRYVISFS